MPRSYSAALPVLYILLRILIVLNLLMAVAILALLLVMPNEEWIMKAFKLTPGPDAERLITGLQAVAMLGLAAIPFNHMVLTKLLAMVQSVRAGDPFIRDNAFRLRTIAWCLLVLQILSMIIGGIGEAVSTPEYPADLNAGFSLTGWLAVLLCFALARVFAEGALMREDLEGTV